MNHTTLRGLIVGPPGMPIPVVQTEGGKWSASRPITEEEAAWMRTHKDRVDIDILNYEDEPCARLVGEKLSEEYVEARPQYGPSAFTAPMLTHAMACPEAELRQWRNSWRGGKTRLLSPHYPFTSIPPKEPTNMNQAQDVQPHWPPLPYLNPKDNTRDKRVAQREDDKARAIFITNLLGLNDGPRPVGATIRPFEQELMREAIDMVLVIIGKNRDYGSCIGESPVLCPHLDPGIAIDVRLSDKISRLESLMKHRGEQNVKDESIEDTKLDMAAYVLLQRVVRKMTPQATQSCQPSNATSAEKTST